ncbi:hypothetical protein LE190_14055 [Massilia oculi]|uniref:Uncharacterized protein n=1 Tax=Massilia hydrophila TaxID=3044279 RepID=A0ABS7YBH3_9BURK|nr:hypothetical protein [Massilia oculi]MCA1857041.1 hypothetical protein [Massilia oculi]
MMMKRRISQNRLLATMLLLGSSPALAIPPPPPEPPRLRIARMTATVQLIEATNGTVARITELCKVSGKIPVYADDGRRAYAHGWRIPGCSMSWNGRKLDVDVWGAKAVSKGRATYARASVVVVPPDAKPLCPDICGPQPLADAMAEVRVSGTPKRMAFGLNANAVSMLNARPTVWLEAEVEIAD